MDEFVLAFQILQLIRAGKNSGLNLVFSSFGARPALLILFVLCCIAPVTHWGGSEESGLKTRFRDPDVPAELFQCCDRLGTQPSQEPFQ